MSSPTYNSGDLEENSSAEDRDPSNQVKDSNTESNGKTEFLEDKDDYDSDHDFEADEWNPSDDEFEKSAVLEREKYIKTTTAVSLLEKALKAELDRKDVLISRLTTEMQRLKRFLSKRKQTYKRKRKAEGAPTRALSAYNIFVQDRFSQLAKENEAALKSEGVDSELKRVPPATLVAATGNEWKDLPVEEKARYEERAQEDRKRYKEQMTSYRAPEKQTGKKRLKTGYNMFFSAHAQQLKQNENGIPSERGSIARIVGNAWKELPNETKQLYEQEADRYNAVVTEDVDDDSEKALSRKTPIPLPMKTASPGEILIMPPPVGAPVVHQPGQHENRIHPAGSYPYPFYDYGRVQASAADNVLGRNQHVYPPLPFNSHPSFIHGNTAS